MFIIGVSNSMGVEAWYPYTNSGAYPPQGRTAGIRYENLMTVTLTNDSGMNDSHTGSEEATPLSQAPGRVGNIVFPARDLDHEVHPVYRKGPPRSSSPSVEIMCSKLAHSTPTAGA
jgi:hypothetical protein